LTRHIIFDLDGTLVDSCGICVEILSDMLVERGSDHVIDPVFARQYMSRGGQDMVAALLGPACTDPATELAEFRARYQDYYTPADALYSGVAESLSRLHSEGFSLAICSNKPQQLCEKVLEDTGLASYFSVILGSQPGLRTKPAPDLLEAVLERLDGHPRECLFVGDSEIDHAVAEAASMPFLFMRYGYAIENWAPGDHPGFDCFRAMTDTIFARVAPSHA
jgi:phosphoglycolate phosphatase